MVGQVRGLRRLEHHHRGGRRASPGERCDPAIKRPQDHALEDLKSEDAPPQRRPTGIAEFDRVTGGGLVPGSALLVGGDPGIGKSTIILQALGAYAQNGGHAIYISGEEAMAQVRMRAARMGLSDAPLMLGAATNVEDILATLEAGKPPGIVAIDSIQTLWTGALDAAPGTIAQVRTASFDLVRYAKASGAALLLVGHVTKDGQIAGPKAVEHLVDAVLYFEGERGHHFRVLRAVKNRFGATDEIGVFEMTGNGPGRSRQSLGAVSGRPHSPPRRARRCSRAWKARGRCSAKSRRWCRRPATAPRAAPWSAGTPGGWP